MELTINIKDRKQAASFLKLIREFDYVEIVDVKEDDSEAPYEHKLLLDERLNKVEEGTTTFRKIKPSLMEPRMADDGKIKRFTKKQLIDRARKADEDYLSGNYKSQEQLEAESENW